MHRWLSGVEGSVSCSSLPAHSRAAGVKCSPIVPLAQNTSKTPLSQPCPCAVWTMLQPHQLFSLPQGMSWTTLSTAFDLSSLCLNDTVHNVADATHAAVLHCSTAQKDWKLQNISTMMYGSVGLLLTILDTGKIRQTQNSTKEQHMEPKDSVPGKFWLTSCDPVEKNYYFLCKC